MRAAVTLIPLAIAFALTSCGKQDSNSPVKSDAAPQQGAEEAETTEPQETRLAEGRLQPLYKHGCLRQIDGQLFLSKPSGDHIDEEAMQAIHSSLEGVHKRPVAWVRLSINVDDLIEQLREHDENVDGFNKDDFLALVGKEEVKPIAPNGVVEVNGLNRFLQQDLVFRVSEDTSDIEVVIARVSLAKFSLPRVGAMEAKDQFEPSDLRKPPPRAKPERGEQDVQAGNQSELPQPDVKTQRKDDGSVVAKWGNMRVPCILVCGGFSFSPSPLRVDSELSRKHIIRIESYDGERRQLVPASDSAVPQVDPRRANSKIVTLAHAVNVTWEFAKPGIQFTADGDLYETEKEDATISFTRDGVNMDGIFKKAESEVWRFDEFSETEADGTQFMAIWVFDPTSRYSIDLLKSRYYIPVPNADGAKALPPDEKLMTAIRKITKGELVDVYLSDEQTVKRIEKSDLPPEEDMPDSRVFGQVTTTQFKDVEYPAVTLRKYRREQTYPIGQMEDGKWVPNKALEERMPGFVHGDLVQVDLQAEEPNVLRMGMEYFVTAMVPYELPKVGTVVTVQDKTEDSPAIVKVTVEGENAPATYYHEGSGKLEPGQQIWFRPSTKEGKDYLNFIWWKKE